MASVRVFAGNITLCGQIEECYSQVLQAYNCVSLSCWPRLSQLKAEDICIRITLLRLMSTGNHTFSSLQPPLCGLNSMNTSMANKIECWKHGYIGDISFDILPHTTLTILAYNNCFKALSFSWFFLIFILLTVLSFYFGWLTQQLLSSRVR